MVGRSSTRSGSKKSSSSRSGSGSGSGSLSSALRHSDRIRNLEKRSGGSSSHSSRSSRSSRATAAADAPAPEKDCHRVDFDQYDLDKINVRRLTHNLLKEFCSRYRRSLPPGVDRVVDLRGSRVELLKWAESMQVKRTGKAPGRDDPYAEVAPRSARLPKRRGGARTAGYSSAPSIMTPSRATPTSTARPAAATAAGAAPSAYYRAASKPPAYNAAAPTYRPAAATGFAAPTSTFEHPQKPVAVAPQQQRQQHVAPRLDQQHPPAQWPDVSLRGTSGLLAHSHSNNVNNNHNFNNNNNSNNSGWVGGDVNPHSAAPYNDERPKPTGPPPNLPALPGRQGPPHQPPHGPPPQGHPPQGHAPPQGHPPQGQAPPQPHQ